MYEIKKTLSDASKFIEDVSIWHFLDWEMKQDSSLDILGEIKFIYYIFLWYRLLIIFTFFFFYI